jgi:L-fucose isomerase-like protein
MSVFDNNIKIGFVPSYRGEWGSIPPWCVQMRAEALAVLSKVTGLELVVPQPCPENNQAVDPERGYSPDGAVGNLDQGEAIAEYFARKKVDGLIICALNFGDERSAAKIAEKLGVPVMLYATKEPEALEDPGLGRVSDSYCGTLSIASALYRRKISFHYAGIFFHDQPLFLQEVETFVRAVSVVKGLRGARIGQVGVRPANFETVGYDETAMIRKFGQNVIFAEVSDLVLRAQRFADDDPAVIAKIDAIQGEVAQVTVAKEYLQKAAKMELAVMEFYTRNRLSALAMQCWPNIQSLWGFSTCALFGRLTGQGILTACEVDILGALAMLVSSRAALGQTVPHFIDWTIQHRLKDNQFLAWHCGNAPACLANDPARTALRSRRDMQGVLPVDPSDSMAGLYQFQIRAGKVTFCRLQEYDNEWKMLITTGEIMPSDEILAGTWAWVEVADHRKLYRTLVEEGFVHHASMIHGDQTAALLEACKFLDIRPVVVE